MQSDERPVRNPFAGNGRYRCFGCDPDHPGGLRLTFTRTDTTVRSVWQPGPHVEGYPGVVHGGIQATLADEIGSWFLYAIVGTAGVTTDLSIGFLQTARVDDGPFELIASARDIDDKRATVRVELRNAAGTLCATATCTYALFSEHVARKRFDFPGRDAF